MLRQSLYETCTKAAAKLVAHEPVLFRVFSILAEFFLREKVAHGAIFLSSKEHTTQHTVSYRLHALPMCRCLCVPLISPPRHFGHVP